MKYLDFARKLFRTPKGACVPHRKNTKHMESVYMPSPKSVVIPMSQHIGGACVPAVEKGEHVYLGDLIGESSGRLSAPIHSSVSGTVKNIRKLRMPSGELVDAVEIESDGKDELSPSIGPPKVYDKESFIKAIKESGLVGLGGAGFPSYMKLSIPKGKNVDTLIVNAAECEPYITADHRECIENSWELFSGIYTIKELLGIDRVIIGVEDNKPDVIKVLKQIADNREMDPRDRVRVLPLESRYPQGAEKVLVKSCTGREVPSGEIPLDVGCIVMNVNSVAFISRYLKTGVPLVKSRITVDGSAVREPKNVIAPVGTRICDVIEFCGGYKKEPKKILMGGPMMGTSVYDDSLPVLKQNNAILVFDAKDSFTKKPSTCIRCGRCVRGCPMGLFPYKLEKYSINEDTKNLIKYDALNCMECGVCVYNCPASRPIVGAIKVGKAKVKSSK